LFNAQSTIDFVRGQTIGEAVQRTICLILVAELR